MPRERVTVSTEAAITDSSATTTEPSESATSVSDPTLIQVDAKTLMRLIEFVAEMNGRLYNVEQTFGWRDPGRGGGRVGLDGLNYTHPASPSTAQLIQSFTFKLLTS